MSIPLLVGLFVYPELTFKEQEMNLRKVAGVLASVSLLGLSVQLGTAPASATTSTLTIADTQGFYSLNPAQYDSNAVINSNVAALTGNGFWYYDNTPTLKANTAFGSYKITKNEATDFEVTFNIKAGQTWSDGTPIDAVDLLLSHVISSSQYSTDAGLGDPESNDGSRFYSGGYGGAYDNHVVGLPVLSNGNMSMTLKFDEYQPDWQVQTPGVFPVHTLEAMQAGHTTLQTAAANLSYKAQFLDDFLKAPQGVSASVTDMRQMGDIWSQDYQFETHGYTANSKPLLTVSNGAYLLTSFDYDAGTVILDLNAKYKSGPALPKTGKVTRVVYQYVADGTPAVQALANGDIDVYNGMSGAAGLATLQGLKNAGKINLNTDGTSSTYEHLDLRVGSGQGQDSSATPDYNGPFAASKGAKGKELRLAFLLAFPRYACMVNQLRAFKSNATLLNSNMTLAGGKYYSKVLADKLGNGLTTDQKIKIGKTTYTYNWNVTSADQQSANEAIAQKLVEKYYGAKSTWASNSKYDANGGLPIAINLLRSSRQMRVENNAVIVAHEATVGFKVSNATTSGWSSKLDYNTFDAAEFAWVPTAIIQDGAIQQYLSYGVSNHSGWQNDALDTILEDLQGKLTDTAIAAKMAAADRIVTSSAWTLPMYQWPSVTGSISAISGINAGPLAPNVEWNYWQWHF